MNYTIKNRYIYIKIKIDSYKYKLNNTINMDLQNSIKLSNSQVNQSDVIVHSGNTIEPNNQFNKKICIKLSKKQSENKPENKPKKKKMYLKKKKQELIQKIDDIKEIDKYINENKKTEPWCHILSDFINKLIEKKPIEITSEFIKNRMKSYEGSNNKQNEPRLLCSQNSNKKRPKIFKLFGLYLFPIKNGTYLVSCENIYYNLDKIDSTNIVITSRKKDNSSQVLRLGNSEMSNIDNLRYSGFFEDILGEPITHDNIFGGRHRTHQYTMNIGLMSIEVKGVQFEADAVYETENKILLIEAKNNKVKSFNIRQLYNPYRFLSDQCSKEIVCLFIYKFREISYIYKFKFLDKNKLSSIKMDEMYKVKFM